MANWKNAVQNKINNLKAQAEFSEKAVDALVQIGLAEDILLQVKTQADRLEKVLAREFKTSSRWEYGSVVGEIGRFINLWVYTPEELKRTSGLEIPLNAFTSESTEAWGRLVRCTPLGEVLPSTEPDLESVAMQVELVKAYLGLPSGEGVDAAYTVLTEAEWSAKEVKSSTHAAAKAQRLQAELAEEALRSASGAPSFLVNPQAVPFTA